MKYICVGRTCWISWRVFFCQVLIKVQSLLTKLLFLLQVLACKYWPTSSPDGFQQSRFKKLFSCSQMSIPGGVAGLWHCIPCFCCTWLPPKTSFSKGNIQKKLHRMCVYLSAGIGKFLLLGLQKIQHLAVLKMIGLMLIMLIAIVMKEVLWFQSVSLPYSLLLILIKSQQKQKVKNPLMQPFCCFWSTWNLQNFSFCSSIGQTYVIEVGLLHFVLELKAEVLCL